MILKLWSSFHQLNLEELYEILKVRQQVFTVEQHCAYQDADGLDCRAWHLHYWHQDCGQRRIVGYLRVLPPGSRFEEPSIGRLLTVPAIRRTGIGRALMLEALEKVAMIYPDWPIRISAQCYLKSFYTDLGFYPTTDTYDEDGIPHISMLRLPQEKTQ